LSAKRFDPRMTRIPVLGAAMANPSNYSSCLGNQSGSVDVGNMHSFPGGENPEAQVKGSTWSLAGFKTNALLSYPGKPLWSTETGYHNATWSSSGHRPASEQVAAIYGVQLPIHYALRGIDRAFFYELLDDGTTSDIEDHFGLVRNDWSRKPLFTGLRNLLAILADSGPAPMTSLAYTATGPPALRRVLAQKSDGSWWLALYNDVRIWDSATASPISQPTTTATVTFTSPRNVSVYDPARGTGAIASAAAVTRTNITLPPAQLVLVRIV
jgi:hypothetical protein